MILGVVVRKVGSSLGCTCWDIFVNVVVYLKWLLTVGICCGGVLLRLLGVVVDLLGLWTVGSWFEVVVLRLLGVVVDLLGLSTVGGWFEVMVLWFGTTGRSPLVVVLVFGTTGRSPLAVVGVFVTVFLVEWFCVGTFHWWWFVVG